MPKTIAVIQARMGSERFPGKTLKPIWNELSLLDLILCRLQKAQNLQTIVLAIPNRVQDQALIDVAKRHQVQYCQGDEQDVLSRFELALNQYPADAVVRICADNPLIDPIEIDKLVNFYWKMQPCDYAYNNQTKCGLPDGVGAEIVSADVLIRLAETPIPITYREHAFSLWIYEHPELFTQYLLKADTFLHRPFYRLDVNHPKDLEFVRALIQILPKEKAPWWSTQDIIQVLDTQQDLLDLREPENIM